MTAGQLLNPSVPLWAWFALVGVVLFLAGVGLLLVKGGAAVEAARADCLLPTDDDWMDLADAVQDEATS